MFKPSITLKVTDGRGKHRKGCKNPNAGRKPGSLKKVEPEKIEELKSMYEQGCTQAQMCFKLNLGIHIVLRLLKDIKNASSSQNDEMPQNPTT